MSSGGMDIVQLLLLKSQLHLWYDYVPPENASERELEWAERRAMLARDRLNELAPVFAVAEYAVSLEGRIEKLENIIRATEEQA